MDADAVFLGQKAKHSASKDAASRVEQKFSESFDAAAKSNASGVV